MEIKLKNGHLKGFYSQTANFNELDYTSSEVVDINLTLTIRLRNITILRRKLCGQYLKTIMNTTRNQ